MKTNSVEEVHRRLFQKEVRPHRREGGELLSGWWVGGGVGVNAPRESNQFRVFVGRQRWIIAGLQCITLIKCHLNVTEG